MMRSVAKEPSYYDRNNHSNLKEFFNENSYLAAIAGKARDTRSGQGPSRKTDFAWKPAKSHRITGSVTFVRGLAQDCGPAHDRAGRATTGIAAGRPWARARAAGATTGSASACAGASVPCASAGPSDAGAHAGAVARAGRAGPRGRARARRRPRHSDERAARLVVGDLLADLVRRRLPAPAGLALGRARDEVSDHRVTESRVKVQPSAASASASGPDGRAHLSFVSSAGSGSAKSPASARTCLPLSRIEIGCQSLQ